MQYAELLEKLKGDLFGDEFQKDLSDTITRSIEAIRKPEASEEIPTKGSYDEKAVMKTLGVPESLSVPGWLKTGDGSIINMKNSVAPWHYLSPYMEAWFSALAKKVKDPTAPVEKVLQESQDQQGGYAIVV